MKRRPLRIRITRVGWLFILLNLGVGASALNTGNNLLYLVFAMMLSFMILSMLLSNNTLSRLWVRPSFPHRIFARETVPVQLQLENRKRRFPSFSIALAPKGRFVERHGRTFIIKIPPKSAISAVGHVRFPRRGRQILPAYEAETNYPFGLIQKTLSIPSEGEVIVYPELFSIESWLPVDRRLHGEFLSGQKGGSTNPYGLRDLVFGDSARHIHWKSSARQRKFKVKEFEREKRVCVFLDLQLASVAHSNPAWQEKAVSAAASLLLNLSGRGFEVGLRLNGKTIEPKGHGYLDAFLTALALVKPPEREQDFSDAPEDATRIVISDLPARALPQDPLIAIGREELEQL